MQKDKIQKNIPKGWRKKRMRELYDITSSKRVFQSEWRPGGVPFYRAREIIKLSRYGRVKNDLFISKEMYDKYRNKYGVPKKDDLLVTGVGTIGVLYRVKDKKEFYFKDGNIIWFKCKKLVLSCFIEQLFKTTLIKRQILNNTPITTVATYTIDVAKKTIVCLPSIAEQKQIVGVLGVWDEFLEGLAEKIEIKKRIKKGLMQNLLTGKKRLKGFNGEWKSMKLGNICGRIRTGKLDANAMIKNGKYRFYTCAKEYYRINDFFFNTEALLISGNGANVGYIHYYNGKFNAYQRTYVLDRFLADIFFIKYILDKNLKQRIYSEKCDGNTPYIKMDTLTDMVIKIPRIEEQKAIAGILTTADEEIEVLEEKRRIIEAQKKYLLNNLITGKIRVPEFAK